MNTAASEPMNAVNVLCARSIGTVMGTDTICAPMISSIFQRKPLAGPYRSTIVLGAASTVVWHGRHAAFLIWIGRDKYSWRPVGVSRSPMISVVVDVVRNTFTTSASQSAARSRGLVGLSVASL